MADRTHPDTGDGPTDEDRLQDEAARIVASLSLKRKVGLMSGALPFREGIRALIAEDYYHRHPFPAAAVPEHGLEGLRFIDGPRGVVLHGGATTFPVPMARGASFDPDLEGRIGRAIGREHRAMGGNLFGGVCINLLRHPGWGRAQETYGEDPVLLGAMGAALTRGVQTHVMACAKHFAVNSMENSRFRINVTATPKDLHEVYLPHFREVVEAGVASIMSAYNALNGEWCGQNRWLLRDVLKDKWGFRGFVLTDFVFGMRDARAAALAGQDLEMPFRMHFDRFLLGHVRAGRVPEKVVDEAATRLIAQQLRFRDTPVPDRTVLGCAEHIALAREAARKSFVLLANRPDEAGRKVLPLSRSERIAVIGRLADRPNLGDRGSSDGRPDYVVTPLEGVRRGAGDAAQITHDDGRDIDRAARAAGMAETAVVVVGYTHEDEGEYIAPISLEPFADGVRPPGLLDPLFRLPGLRGLWRRLVAGAARKAQGGSGGSSVPGSFGRGGDRRSLRLRDEDVRLIEAVCKVNPRTVVLVMSGSAVMMEEWKHLPSAIMMIWYPGMEGGNALADVLYGDHEPGGRLPFTIATHDTHLPDFDIDASEVTYDAWHGYRRLAREGHKAAWPFGFGLGYADLRIDEIDVVQPVAGIDTDIEIRVRVVNAGERAGETVLQVYGAPETDDPDQRVPSLKAFTRIKVPLSGAVYARITVPARRFSAYDAQADDMVIRPGRYELCVAQHCEDEAAHRLTVTVA